MAGFKLNVFKGLRPRVSATKLERGDAQTAQNLKLGSGDLEPIPDKSTVQAVGSGRSSRSIYRFNNAGNPIWFEWDDRVDVVRGPVKDDSIERTYYTGDTTGTGAPKVTTTALADQGGGGPYPEDWMYLGVPAPVSAPTVTPTDLPEEKSASGRLAGVFRTDELNISKVQWTTYPGTGTRNQTWRPAAGAVGNISFDISPGTSFRVTSIINSNKVTLESATEAGITMRTAEADKSASDYWKAMDEQGTTQLADWIGWRVPVGMTVTIPGHNLIVGDVIVATAVNQTPELFLDTTTDFYEQDWDTPELIDDLVTGGFYLARDAAVSAAAVSGDVEWQINGSFYYDVDRAGSTSSELEDRSYVYTYVNNLGEEGPPSPPSTFTAVLDGQSVLLSDLALPPTIGYDIEKVRLYRTNSTEAGTEYQFVQEFDVTRTNIDLVKSADLGEVIASTTWDPPAADMVGITTMPNGMLVGFSGKQIFFCEPYMPHAWPAEYDQAVDYNIVGLASIGNSVIAVTKGWPYVITGSHPRNANIRPIKINQACVSKESIATDGDKVYYASPDGIIEVSVNGVRIATESLMDKDDWATYSPSSLVSEFYEGRYYGFYDFDVSSVEAVITAEVSGTVATGEEADIVNGGLTVILTLTNDNWIPLGTSFNAQRQNIIDGLTATTNQTLGWNNLVRDTELAVGDVVRTDDTTVTITLPTVSGYAISSAEVVRATIPAAALLISNDPVSTQTFTITPDAYSATVTLSGTLGGAAESDVVTGGNTVIITLTNDTWQTTLTTAMKQAIIDGLKATTDEQSGWNDEVPQLISTTSVVRTSDSVVTITLPAVAAYAVTANETITATIPHEALVLQENVDAVSSNSLAVTATGALSALFSGTVTTATENEIVAGGKTLIITLTNDTWIAAGTGPIGTTAQSQALLDALIATTSQTLGWNNVVVPGIDVATDLVRTSSTVATITLDPEATYSIASNETVGCTIPGAVLTGAADLVVANTFGITAQTPVTCALSGTVTASIDEDDITAGGKTIILTLSDDTWAAAGTGPIGSTATTQAIIDGIDSAQAEGTGWDAEVKANLVPATDVVRTSDTVCTITLPAEAAYDITAQETITATIPAAALNTSASSVVAAPTFTIDFVTPATAAVTGTATSSMNETDVVNGGKTIIITLTSDNWVAAGAVFNAIRQDIIDGLDSAQAEAGGWDAKVKAVMAETAVVRTSSTVVTVTLPATADYAITSNETITVTVPASALVTSPTPVVATPTIGILAQATPTTAVLSGTVTASIDEDDITTGGKTIILTLSDDTWAAAGTGPIGSTADTQAIIDGIDSGQAEGTGWDAVVKAGLDPATDVARTSDTVCTITLPAEATYDITAQETITATIPAAALNVSATPVLASPTFTVDFVAPPAPTVALTGTITSSTDEADIVTGGKTIILTLTNGTWAAAGTGPIGSTADTQAIIDGISAAGTPLTGWNNEIRDGSLTPTQVVRTSDTVCTITLVADADYDISANETITATVPAAAIVESAIPVVASPTFSISFVPYVSLTGETAAQYNPGGVCYSGFRFNSDGTIEEMGPGLADFLQIDAGDWWSDQPSAGIGASYEIRFLSAGKTGTWTSFAEVDDTWYPLTAGATWYNRVRIIDSPLAKPCSGTFEIRLASSGSALDSAFYSATAEN
jgi:hypothetical protein